jgi:serine phosphatase RsbU (regulator of sigma subunit)
MSARTSIGSQSGSWWSRLHVRMTISYLVVATSTALLLELAVVIGLFLAVSALLTKAVPIMTRNAARVYAVQAALQASNTGLDPRTTFQPGQPASIALSGSDDTGEIPFIDNQVPYLDPHAPPPVHDHSAPIELSGFALLVTPNGHVLASSDPAHEQPSKSVTDLLAGPQARAVLTALGGQAGQSSEARGQERFVFATEPVWSKDKQVLGVMYVQVSTPSAGTILQVLAQGWLRSGLLLLVLLTPPCALVGALTTRGQVRRLHQLTRATARFATGDYTQRIASRKHDEIGQLEAQFNQMAEQVVESIASQRRLTEQQARMEERARLEQELQTAQAIQRSLLPKEMPQLPGWQIAAHYQPAREVGGDLYDFLPLADGRWGLVIGYATDKGVPAALLMASARSMIRAAALVMDAPGALLAHVNELLCTDTPLQMFVTCFYALLDPASGRVRYANAGHDLPYLRSGGEVRELCATGMPLGVMSGSRYEEQEVLVVPGEEILFYSDGLVEAHNSGREMFGFPRLQAVLAQHGPQTSHIEFVREALARFTGEEWEQEDDVTLVMLQRMAEDT